MGNFMYCTVKGFVSPNGYLLIMGTCKRLTINN